jgi:ribosome-interacting GTPase 1
MASTNQSPFYKKAEQEFHNATTDNEKITCLEIMIKECPKHKSSEKMLRNLTTRLKKFKSNLARQKKSGKTPHKGIKKTDMQCVLVGFTNTGKSTIFKTITNLNPKISSNPFTTNKPQLGTFKFEDTQIQIIDAPSFPKHDKSLIISVDTLLLVIDDISQIQKAEQYLYQTKAKTILIFNKEDLMSGNKKRKIEATLKSKYKKYDYIFFLQTPTITKLNELKQKIFNTFPTIRIYTKEPKKSLSETPMILKQNSTLEDAAEKILKGMSKKIKRAKIWGPSSKFGGQTIGLAHILKDKDIIELQTV